VNTWIFIDADNTLWDTDALFAEAQLALLGTAEELCGVRGPTTGRLEFVRAFDQAIAARHHQRLRYPPALLVRALCNGLKGVSPDNAAQRALTEGSVPADADTQAVREYSAVIARLPPILDGVQHGLRLAHDHGVPVYVISEGPLETVRARLEAHDLEWLTTGILSAAKTRDLYARLKQRAEPHRAVMIGDQPDRDIRLAHEAGLHTILIPSPFQPNWVNSRDAKYADAVAQDLHEAVKWAIRSDAPLSS
jgi:putative hydrolase of the HAD superfamily